jgi:hypothetical protein
LLRLEFACVCVRARAQALEVCRRFCGAPGPHWQGHLAGIHLEAQESAAAADAADAAAADAADADAKAEADAVDEAPASAMGTSEVPAPVVCAPSEGHSDGPGQEASAGCAATGEVGMRAGPDAHACTGEEASAEVRVTGSASVPAAAVGSAGTAGDQPTRLGSTAEPAQSDLCCDHASAAPTASDGSRQPQQRSALPGAGPPVVSEDASAPASAAPAAATAAAPATAVEGPGAGGPAAAPGGRRRSSVVNPALTSTIMSYAGFLEALRAIGTLRFARVHRYPAAPCCMPWSLEPVLGLIGGPCKRQGGGAVRPGLWGGGGGGGAAAPIQNGVCASWRGPAHAACPWHVHILAPVRSLRAHPGSSTPPTSRSLWETLRVRSSFCPS